MGSRLRDTAPDWSLKISASFCGALLLNLQNSFFTGTCSALRITLARPFLASYCSWFCSSSSSDSLVLSNHFIFPFIPCDYYILIVQVFLVQDFQLRVLPFTFFFAARIFQFRAALDFPFQRSVFSFQRLTLDSAKILNPGTFATSSTKSFQYLERRFSDVNYLYE